MHLALWGRSIKQLQAEVESRGSNVMLLHIPVLEEHAPPLNATPETSTPLQSAHHTLFANLIGVQKSVIVLNPLSGMHIVAARAGVQPINNKTTAKYLIISSKEKTTE